MGLMKSLHTKVSHGEKLSIAEKRFAGISPWPKSKKKKTPNTEQTDKEFVTDMLKGLL